MRRLVLLLVLPLALTLGARAQDAELAAAPAEVHLLEIRDGALHLDGRRLPDAAPPGVDLRGLAMAMEFAGPVKPVVEIDGLAFVLVDDKLVRYDESLTQGRLYIAGEAQMTGGGAMPADRMARMGEQAYFQEIAERDTDLYGRMQRERRAESEGEVLAAQIRATPPGAEHDRLRAHLRDHLADVFRLKLRIRREELARAQAEMDSVGDLLDQREANLDAIVDARVAQLCGE